MTMAPRPLALQMGSVTNAVDDLVSGYEQLVESLPAVSQQVANMHQDTETMAQELQDRTKALVDGYEYLQGISTQIPEMFQNFAAEHRHELQNAMHVLSAHDQQAMQQQEQELERLKGELHALQQERTIIDVLSRPAITESKRAKDKQQVGQQQPTQQHHAATPSTKSGRHRAPPPFHHGTGQTGHIVESGFQPPVSNSNYNEQRPAAGMVDPNAPIALPDYTPGAGGIIAPHSARGKSVLGAGGPLVSARAVGGSVLVPSMKQGTLPPEVQNIKTSPTMSLSEAAKLEQEMYKNQTKKKAKKKPVSDWHPFAKSVKAKLGETNQAVDDLREELKKASTIFGKDKAKAFKKLQRIAQELEGRQDDREAALLSAVEKLMKEAVSPLQDRAKDAEALTALQQLLLPDAAAAATATGPRQQYKVMAVGGRRALQEPVPKQTIAPPPPEQQPQSQPVVPIRKPMELPEISVDDKAVGTSIEPAGDDMKQYTDDLFNKLRGEMKDWLNDAIQAIQPAPVKVEEEPKPSLERDMLEMMQTVFMAQQKTMQGNQALLLSLIHQQQEQPPAPEPLPPEPLPERVPTPVKDEPIDLQPPVVPLQMAASEPVKESVTETVTTAFTQEEIEFEAPAPKKNNYNTALGNVLLEGDLLKGRYALKKPKQSKKQEQASKKKVTIASAMKQLTGSGSITVTNNAAAASAAASSGEPESSRRVVNAFEPVNASDSSSSDDSDAEAELSAPSSRKRASVSTMRALNEFKRLGKLKKMGNSSSGNADSVEHIEPTNDMKEKEPVDELSPEMKTITAVLKALGVGSTGVADTATVAQQVQQGVQMGVKEALKMMDILPSDDVLPPGRGPRAGLINGYGIIRGDGGKNSAHAARRNSPPIPGDHDEVVVPYSQQQLNQQNKHNEPKSSFRFPVDVHQEKEGLGDEQKILDDIDQSRQRARELIHRDDASSFDDSCSLDEETAAMLRDPLAEDSEDDYRSKGASCVSTDASYVSSASPSMAVTNTKVRDGDERKALDTITPLMSNVLRQSATEEVIYGQHKIAAFGARGASTVESDDDMMTEYGDGSICSVPNTSSRQLIGHEERQLSSNLMNGSGSPTDRKLREKVNYAAPRKNPLRYPEDDPEDWRSVGSSADFSALNESKKNLTPQHRPGGYFDPESSFDARSNESSLGGQQQLRHKKGDLLQAHSIDDSASYSSASNSTAASSFMSKESSIPRLTSRRNVRPVGSSNNRDALAAQMMMDALELQQPKNYTQKPYIRNRIADQTNAKGMRPKDRYGFSPNADEDSISTNSNSTMRGCHSSINFTGSTDSSVLALTQGRNKPQLLQLKAKGKSNRGQQRSWRP